MIRTSTESLKVSQGLQLRLLLLLCLRLLRHFRFLDFRRSLRRLCPVFRRHRLLLLGVVLQRLVELPPGAIDARALAAPPLVDVLNVGRVLLVLGVVEHGADAAKELCVDELASALEKRQKKNQF